MRITIYESSSFGGCYDYSLQLLQAYANQVEVESVKLLLPTQAKASASGIRKKLLPDELATHSVFLKKLWFIFRTFYNPLILFFHLLFQKKSYVLLNDFEQLSAWLWAPMFRIFLRKHTFAVFLHDPDRDAYPPSQKVSAWLMRCMMQTMHLAFYHEILPQKTYYNSNNRTRYIAVPHGIYPAPKPDSTMQTLLKSEIKERYCFAQVGNIRHEKSTDLAIRALANHPDAHLIIAGKAASSSVDVDQYKSLAKECKVHNRITWINRFLTEAELSAVISSTDAILLYYRSTFASQSAILNLIAPFRKTLIVSETPSALTNTVRTFSNGILAKADKAEELSQAMHLAQKQDAKPNQWDAFLQYASWQRNAEIAVQAFLRTNDS